MAEGSEKRERDAAEARRQRADWFGKSVGDEWIEVEPGIYRHRSLWHAPPLSGHAESETTTRSRRG